MSAFFNKVFKGRDYAGSSSKKSQQLAVADVKSPQDEDPWLRTVVSPEEIRELLRLCTKELKLRGLSTPFVLLPFRPVPDPGTPRNFIRVFFNNGNNGGRMTGPELEQELRLTDPMVLCGILKWCWSRLPGGVVTWEVYELFRVGETDSNMARDAFSTFIPISVDSQARAQIIFDFFDLFSAIAAHAKTNGLAGLKLSRLAGWWAFEHVDTGWGFDGGYSSWTRAADATMHLFFAYLRSLAPEDPAKGSSVPMLPTSLRALLHSVEYPPPKPAALHSKSVKVVMTVETVSPTPFALLRRAKHFQFRDDDKTLQAFVEFDDPIQCLTDENKRVLKCISQTNESSVATIGLRSRPSWSKFQDIGFSGVLEGNEDNTEVREVKEEPLRSPTSESFGESFRKRAEMGPSHRTGEILARPTTPSWADFMVAGFATAGSGGTGQSPLLLPPDKQLPPIETAGSRVRSSQSNVHTGDDPLDPGELASVTPMDIDDAFWWVWMSSLSGEESSARKAVFGRCALAETKADEGRWLVLEEKVKGAAQATNDTTYIANKKGSKRGRLTKLGRRKSVGKSEAPKAVPGVGPVPPPPRPNIHPEAAARVQSVAAQIRQQSLQRGSGGAGQHEISRKNSAFQLQPVVVSEAASAMKWASKYDREAIRDAYLKGTPTPYKSHTSAERSLPALPKEEQEEKPLPNPLLSTKTISSSTRPGPIDVPIAAVEERPASPVERRSPPPASATSPKSVQSSTSVSSPEKLSKTKGSRLGKLFGRRSDKQGPSRSTTPLPEPVLKSVSVRDVSAPLNRNTVINTNGNGTSVPARSSAITVNDSHIATRSSRDNFRSDNLATKTKSDEERIAKKLSSNFDAGPLVDMPAFVPEDSPEPSPIIAHHKVENDNDVTPLTSIHPSLGPPVSPALDRWAQNRKLAADRAKKNAVDDHTPTGSEVKIASSDDGNTSGEETMESRLARIKARVAELTVLEAHLEQASVLKRVVEAIKDLVQDCNFDCNDTGIALQAMDNSHVALVAMLLRADGFSPYRCDRNIALGINLNSLAKVLRCAQNEDMITLRALDTVDCLQLVFESTENDRISEYDIKLMDIDQEHMGIPETDYAAAITLPSAEFQKICRDLSQLSESVSIEADKECVKFTCSGDIGNGSVALRSHKNVDKPELSTNIELTEPVSLTFSLKYLVNFCKASSLSSTVTLSLATDIPLLVEYKMDNGYVRFYLAPKIDEE